MRQILANPCCETATYAPYMAQQEVAIRAFQRDENLRLPSDLDYSRVNGLSTEERSVLKLTQPESIGQARRIEGVRSLRLLLT